MIVCFVTSLKHNLLNMPFCFFFSKPKILQKLLIKTNLRAIMKTQIIKSLLANVLIVDDRSNYFQQSRWINIIH